MLGGTSLPHGKLVLNYFRPVPLHFTLAFGFYTRNEGSRNHTGAAHSYWLKFLINNS